jgi:hypothetical protein
MSGVRPIKQSCDTLMSVSRDGVQLAPQQPSQRKGHGANLRNEGIRPVGAKTTLVLSQTFEGIFLPTGGNDVFAQ